VTETCETCRFWRHEQHAIGKCRYLPPNKGYPATLATDWCGQWKPILKEPPVVEDQGNMNSGVAEYNAFLSGVGWLMHTYNLAENTINAAEAEARRRCLGSGRS